MSFHSEKRRKPRQKASAGQRDLTIRFGTAESTGFSAKLIDCSGGGLRLEMTRALEEGATVNIVGEIESTLGRQNVKAPCKVRWCTEIGPGRYVTGLSFVTPEEDPTPRREPSSSGEDPYEVLQLSRNADSETIHRVFHLLAARYHPDNKETGSSELFRQVVEANNVLSDPERRAALDARLSQENTNRFHLFKSVEESRGVEAEIRKRQAILRLLYGKRLMEPHQASMGARELEELLACPREHLEFSFWLLKESKFISRSDNNRFEITIQGALAFEVEERNISQSGSRRSAPELLSAALA